MMLKYKKTDSRAPRVYNLQQRQAPKSQTPLKVSLSRYFPVGLHMKGSPKKDG